MAHATVTDFITVFSLEELEDLALLDSVSSPSNPLDPNDPTQAAVARIQRNLESASAIINAKINSGIQLAISIDGSILRHICLEIARWLLDKNRERESVKFRYEEAMKLLEALAADVEDSIVGNGGIAGATGSLIAPSEYGLGPSYNCSSRRDFDDWL